ncbi:unnamed protein product [Brassica napus]|uniref:(rape) hypothetical protein n=1 Tax=Brassica napus TaxID=3708 RepID=A0A816KXV9_BRANA|nr:unnamed protein product [Brassica napus]
MVSMRAFCYLLIFFILQLHAKVSHANFNREVPQAAKNGGLGASTSTQITSEAIENVMGNRKALKHGNMKGEANEMNSLAIESKETVRKRKSKKRLTKTVSLTADYSDPGRKKPTHDFLSACSNSNVHPADPMPSSQGGYPKTHDFLQPFEQVGTRASAKEEGTRGSDDTTVASSELKSPYVHNQHVLPGGIGTYTISQMPYLNHNHLQRVPKPKVSPMFTVSQASCNERNAVEDNSVSNCSSYAAKNGFTLWNESIEKRGHTRNRQSQSFMDMIKSAKGNSQEDDMDDDDEEFVTNKGSNTSTSQSQRVDLRVKVDKKGHGNEQKPNTPRSKHSATEQRRRSKINDRFQTLRQLIPNSDQKRDKASFLLEVIQYIHFLQEKVDKHEPPEGTVPVLAEAQAVDMEHQHYLKRATDTTSFPVLGQRNSFFSPELSQLCPVSSSDVAAMECENLREEEEVEELSIHKGTISISSVYSQGLLKTLSETLQSSGVDLSRSRISVQIKLSKQPQEDEEVHLKVRPHLQSGDENHNDDENNNIKQSRTQKKLKKDHGIRNI